MCASSSRVKKARTQGRMRIRTQSDGSANAVSSAPDVAVSGKPGRSNVGTRARLDHLCGAPGGTGMGVGSRNLPYVRAAASLEEVQGFAGSRLPRATGSQLREPSAHGHRRGSISPGYPSSNRPRMSNRASYLGREALPKLERLCVPPGTFPRRAGIRLLPVPLSLGHRTRPDREPGKRTGATYRVCFGPRRLLFPVRPLLQSNRVHTDLPVGETLLGRRRRGFELRLAIYAQRYEGGVVADANRRQIPG